MHTMTQPARTAVTLVLLFCATASVNADQVDRYVEAQMRHFHIPGLSLAVVRDGRIVKERGYGIADVELNVPMTKARVFEIGSMTKQFTATAIMMLVEEGRIGLDDAVSKHLPNVPPAWSRMTVRHLLTHTSGIAGNATRIPAPARGAGRSTNAPDANIRIGNRFYDVSLDFQPGEGWAYSNAGYHLLGVIVSNASGTSCADFTNERILKPLGMTTGRVAVANGIVANRAAGYEWTNGRVENRAFLATVGSMGDVGLNSTVGDLAKWDTALYTEKLLKQSGLQQMWTPITLADGARPAFDYGFGWFLDTYRGHRVVHHPGVTPGFSTSITRFVDDKLTVIVLANGSGQLVDPFAMGIAALYLPALVLPRGGVPDPDPDTSRILRQALVGLTSGTPDLTLFTSATQRFLASGNELLQRLTAFGPLQSFAFADSEHAGRDRVLRYRIVLGDSAFTFSFTLTEQGQIAHAFFW